MKSAEWTREDLEGMDWQVGDNGEVFWPEGFCSQSLSGAKLQAASPKLALACLHLREYVLGVYDGNFPQAAETGNALRIIDAALEAAGVEVEP